MKILETKSLSKSFGGIKAINNLDFFLNQNEVRGVIGPNGSGKSTFFNLLTGIYKADDGSSIFLNGENITNIETHQIVEKGMARTFQLLRLFSEMTVLDNMMVGYHLHVKYGLLASIFGNKSSQIEEKRIKEEMMELLFFIGLADYAYMDAIELSIGQRRLLSLGRAMAMQPKILLLDEPAAGLSPVNVDNLLKIIMGLRERFSTTLVITEHILKVVMETCETITVLDYGTKIAEGTPSEVKNDNRVINAYLGEELDDNQVLKELNS